MQYYLTVSTEADLRVVTVQPCEDGAESASIPRVERPTVTARAVEQLRHGVQHRRRRKAVLRSTVCSTRSGHGPTPTWSHMQHMYTHGTYERGPGLEPSHVVCQRDAEHARFTRSGLSSALETPEISAGAVAACPSHLNATYCLQRLTSVGSGQIPSNRWSQPLLHFFSLPPAQEA